MAAKEASGPASSIDRGGGAKELGKRGRGQTPRKRPRRETKRREDKAGTRMLAQHKRKRSMERVVMGNLG